MAFLDIRTIVLGYVLTDAVCLVVMILLWRQNRGRFAGTVLWVANYVLQLAALILIVLRGVIPDALSIVAANMLVITGALLGYMALLRFVGERRSQVFNYLFLIATCLFHIYFTYVRPEVEGRTLNTSVGLLVMTLQCAWLALVSTPARLRSLTRGVGWVFVAYCLLSLARILNYIIESPTRKDFFQPSVADAASMIAFQLLFIALTFSVALMYNKRLTNDIQTQEKKFSKTFHASPSAINLTRLSDGLILEANAGFLKMSGYAYEDVIGRTVMDLHFWARDDDRIAVFKELANRDLVRGREFQFRTKTGELITALFSAEIIAINNEKCVLSGISDITSRKRAEEALKESNTYLEQLNNALADAVFVVKYPERVVEYANDAAIAMFGYARDEILGKNSNLLYPAREGYLKSGVIFQETLALDKNLARFETILKRKNGATFPGWLTATFLRENGRVTRFIVIIQNITEQKRDNDTIRRLNVELEKRVAERTEELNNTQMALLNLVDDLNTSTREITLANESLEAVNKELAAFSYSVSHDLRAPLRSIDGFSSALLEDCGDQLNCEGKNYLQRIRRATQNMSQLIDDLLNLSRVTKSEFYRQDFDLSAMVRNIAETEQQKNPLADLAIDIRDGITARADQRLMNIAMTNLLDNAWKFTGKCSHPRIEFGVCVRDGETVMYVRDNGVGFDMAYVDKLFGAFQRLHRMDEYPGTGIGLATVQRIINRHGGRIWAEGGVGRGAAFFFTLGT